MKDNTWYNDYLQNLMKDVFIDKYPEFDFNQCMKIAESENLEDFRLLCNMLQKDSFNDGHKIYFDDDDKKDKLMDVCNNRVNKILGEESVKLYNMFTVSQKHELWQGDDRYALFSYNFASVDTRQIIISVVLAKHYMISTISTEIVEQLGQLYSNSVDYNLYYEPTLDNTTFMIRNINRIYHVTSWIKFIDFIWNNDYESAYNIIKDYQLSKST